MEYFAGKTVTVTGGGGSIGSVLCKMLAPHVRELRIVSMTELSLYNVMTEILASGVARCLVVPMLGNVCDAGRMSEAIAGADLVIHTAAHKHVPLCEQNRVQAIINNVRGTLTVASVAGIEGAQLVHVSTDKAVKPESVMGKTKRAAELWLLRAMRRSPSVPLSIVRFGNVMGSSGSVLPLWEKQIAAGGPITVTDRRCTRYFMSLPEACGLVLDVAAMRQSGLFVLDMGEPQSIWELAQQKAALASLAGQRVDVVETGLRPGEKLTEELHCYGELTATSVRGISKVTEPETTGDVHIHGLLAAAATGNEARAMDLLNEAVRW